MSLFVDMPRLHRVNNMNAWGGDPSDTSKVQTLVNQEPKNGTVDVDGPHKL